ncbi:DUF1735 domain-containing protein [Dokdonia sp. R86516]|uniref:DUF1735 domain-containing protein n=1 Tax=Dokdonia sp. R86516 TaxID=3093856 RepID=UPI0037C6775A
MNKLKYIAASLLVGFMTLTSCEDAEIPQVDAENGRAIAGFNGATTNRTVVFNPEAETTTTFTVGVSTLSSSDRTAQLSIDTDASTLAEELYSISTLNPVIPAGSFTVDFTVTTLGSPNLPAVTDVIVLNLESVEGAEILNDSEDRLTLGLAIECPTVDLSQVVGSAVTLENPLLEAFGVPATFSDLRTVIAGPEDNQITILGGISQDVGGTDTVLTIDLDTGFVISDQSSDGGVSFVNGGTPIPTTKISGRVLTCINQIIINVDNDNFGPPFNSLRLKLQVQP